MENSEKKSVTPEELKMLKMKKERTSEINRECRKNDESPVIISVDFQRGQFLAKCYNEEDLVKQERLKHVNNKIYLAA